MDRPCDAYAGWLPTSARGLKPVIRNDKLSEVCILRALGAHAPVWLGGRVVMQRIANPSTPVRFRPEPPLFLIIS